MWNAIKASASRKLSNEEDTPKIRVDPEVLFEKESDVKKKNRSSFIIIYFRQKYSQSKLQQNWDIKASVQEYEKGLS